MNDDTSADLCAFANGDVRINQTARAYDSFMADVTSRADDGIVADRCARLDDDMGLDGNAFTQFRTRGYDRTVDESRARK